MRFELPKQKEEFLGFCVSESHLEAKTTDVFFTGELFDAMDKKNPVQIRDLNNILHENVIKSVVYEKTNGIAKYTIELDNGTVLDFECFKLELGGTPDKFYFTNRQHESAGILFSNFK